MLKSSIEGNQIEFKFQVIWHYCEETYPKYTHDFKA
jgi:hypothetical protein